MRILAVDPGTVKIGIAVTTSNQTPSVFWSEQCLLGDSRKTMEQRLFRLHQKVNNYILQYNPDCIALEDGYIGGNARTSMMIGMARGVVMAVAGAHSLPVYCYPPSVVKKAFTGKGNASKELIQEHARILYPDRDFGEDEADAIAIAHTHCTLGGQTKC